MTAWEYTVRRLSGQQAVLVGEPPAQEDNPGGIADAKLVAWYAARFTIATEGQQLSFLPDSSGNNRSLAQNNVSKRCRWHDNIINGEPTFRFDGGDWYKVPWGETIPQPYQVFVVLNTRTPFGLDDDEVYLSGYTNPAASDKHLFAIVNHTLNIVNGPAVPADPPWWMMENAANDQHVVGGTPLNDTWYVVRVDFESPNGLITVNGVATSATGNAGALSSTGLTLGAREDGNRGTTGDIAEVVFCKNLTSGEKTAVQNELMTVYGI